MDPERPSLLERLPAVAWFFGGMLIACLVVGALLLIAHRSDAVPAPRPVPPTATPTVSLVECPTRDARTLVEAAACGDLEALRAQLAQGAALDATDPRPEFAGRTALHHAAQRGDEAQLRLLLDAGAAPDTPDANGNTALHLLALTSHAEHPAYLARALIEAGARLEVRNADGHTPMGVLEADNSHLIRQQDLALFLIHTAQAQQAAAKATERLALARQSGPDAPASPVPDAPAAPTATPEAAGTAAEPEAAAAPAEPAIEPTLQAWAHAWSAKDMDAYFAHYDSDFVPPDGLAPARWRTQRQARIGDRAGTIEVTLTDFSITRTGDESTAEFTQSYRADDYHDQVRKRLVLVLREDGWRIVREDAVH